MNGKAKKSMRKVLPVGIAMGILFSSNPVTEHKVKADVDTFGTIVTTLGSVYDAFGKEAFTKYLEDANAKSSYDNFWENITYLAPTFKKGEFGITVFDYYKNQDFSQKVKIAYPNGKVEYKTIKHGQQLRIKDAGTVVDLTPDEPELSKHDILYITQKQLDEGKTGVSLTNFKTYYLESDNSGRINELGWKFVKQRFPNAYLSSGLAAAGVDEYDLFKKLPEDKRMLGTSTSKTVGKEALSNYVMNDSEALADFNNRSTNVLANAELMLDTPISISGLSLDGVNNHQIIPYKKGSNKVLVKKGSKYLTGKEGESLYYSDSIGDDEVFQLVQVENNANNQFQFQLINKNGTSLTYINPYSGFTTDKGHGSAIRFPEKSNNEIHNWLREWYPGKENEKQKYDGIQIIADEKDPTKRLAKDSSGTVIKNSWVKQDNLYYYAGSDGILLEGWQEIEGKTYYFDDTILVIKPNGYWIGEKGYHFDAEGALQRSKWMVDNDNLGYSDASGALIENGLWEIDGKMYYFKDFYATTKEIRLDDQNKILHFSDKGVLERVSNQNGEAINGLVYVELDNKTLVFNKDGSILKTGINKLEKSLFYYSFEDGIFYTGWKMIDGKRYYFINGYNNNFDRHETIEGKSYYFNHDGEAKLTGFDEVNGKIYHYNGQGELDKGWHKIDGKWYYFDESGAAKIGWFTGPYETADDGFGYFSYYAKEDGSIYVDTTVVIDGKNQKFDKRGHKAH
ncbi:N-acetylmuramoyl-L-alanine amidase family protein [Bacillus pseudomycoides]